METTTKMAYHSMERRSDKSCWEPLDIHIRSLRKSELQWTLRLQWWWLWEITYSGESRIRTSLGQWTPKYGLWVCCELAYHKKDGQSTKSSASDSLISLNQTSMVELDTALLDRHPEKLTVCSSEWDWWVVGEYTDSRTIDWRFMVPLSSRSSRIFQTIRRYWSKLITLDLINTL